MRTSPNGIALIKSFEGIRDGDPETVNLDPYLCPANVATIGWGHAITEDGGQLKGRDGLKRARELYPDGITFERAEELLTEDVSIVEKDVQRLLRIPVTQNQFDALVSFAFNVGTDIDKDTIAEGLGDSTLLRYLNDGLVNAAAREFPKWVFSGGKKLNGLVRRRDAEKQLFLA